MDTTLKYCDFHVSKFEQFEKKVTDLFSCVLEFKLPSNLNTLLIGIRQAYYASHFAATTQVIRVAPRYQSRIKGTLTSFTCNATHFDHNKQIYRWRLNDVEIHSWNIHILGRYFETVKIIVGSDTVGTYSCYLEDEYGSVKTIGHAELSFLESEKNIEWIILGSRGKCYPDFDKNNKLFFTKMVSFRN